MFDDEVWVDVKGYEGLYKVSNLGRVKTLSRAKVKTHIMCIDCNKGYGRIMLYKKGRGKHYFIHRLVLESFGVDKSNYKYHISEDITDIDLNTLEINHLDENPKNNSLKNLEWCTHLYNLYYGSRRNRVVEKERKPVNQYDKKGYFIKQHYSIQQAARDIGRSAAPICLCCQGKQELAYGYIWRYATEGGV